jgi:BRCA1-associated protein
MLLLLLTGDGYVHRLIQSKTDGKLVEVPSPAPACSHSSPGHHMHHQHSRHRHSHAARSLDRTGSGCSGAAAAANSGSSDQACGASSCPVCVDEQAQMKEALVSSKLDAITLEYNYLLTTQLDSQRQYFEGLMAQQEAKQRQQLAAAQQKADAEAAQKAAAQAAAKEAERRRQQMERKLVRGNSVRRWAVLTQQHMFQSRSEDVSWRAIHADLLLAAVML